MKLRFLKAHSTKDGKHYKSGELADIADANVAQELIRQRIAEEQPAQQPQEPKKDDEETGGRRS